MESEKRLASRRNQEKEYQAMRKRISEQRKQLVWLQECLLNMKPVAAKHRQMLMNTKYRSLLRENGFLKQEILSLKKLQDKN